MSESCRERGRGGREGGRGDEEQPERRMREKKTEMTKIRRWETDGCVKEAGLDRA